MLVPALRLASEPSEWSLAELDERSPNVSRNEKAVVGCVRSSEVRPNPIQLVDQLGANGRMAEK